MQSSSARDPVKNRRDKYGVFVGCHSVNVAEIIGALTEAGVRYADGAVWVRDRLGDEAGQALVDAGQIGAFRQAAGMALLESAKVMWVLAAADPTQALAWAAEDLIAASSTGREARLFVVEDGGSKPLLRALAEIAGHWPKATVEVAALVELPGRVVAWCSTDSEVGGAQ